MAQRREFQETQQHSRRRPLVLYVEDDDEIAEMYGLGLKNDYEVIRLKDGRSVMEWLQQADELPNMVLLDQQLPDMSGLDVFDNILRHPQWRHLFVIMFSNHGDPGVHQRAFEMGALAWFIKSTMTPSQVASRLRSELDKQGEVG